MLGRLQINDTTVTVAFKLGVTANPPFINPIGFTFATNGFGLSDIVDLHEAVSNTTVDESALPPDIRVENVFVAFGTQDDDDLCIRQGFFLAADLHLGGSLSLDAEAPPCDVPPTEPSEATQKCADSDTCIASILLDIDTGVASGTPSVKAAGYFAATELGPLRFDPTRIELELSADTQRLFVSGGAALDDPFDTTPPAAEWASGSFVLDFNTNSLSFVAEISLAEGELLQARATGAGSLDLDDPQFVVTLEFRSGLLDTLAEELETGFNDFVADVNAFGDRLAEARSNNPVLWRNLLTLMEEEGDQPQWLVDMVATFAEVEDTIGGINDTFTSAGLPAPFVGYDLLQIVLHGAETPDFEGVQAPVVVGCVLDSPFGCVIYVDPPGECLGFVQNASGCWFIPPVEIPDIPGLCDGNFFGPQDGLLYSGCCGSQRQSDRQQRRPRRECGIPAGRNQRRRYSIACGDLHDPGDDTHTVEAVWSDGVRQQVSPIRGVRTHTFTRTIQDDNPTATSSDQASAAITVRDKDGESGTATASLTVNNVAPSAVTLTPVGVVGGEEVRDSAGNLVVKEGDLVRWQVSFTDVGVRDSHNVVIDWKDGTSETRFVPANVGGAAIRTFEVTHHYVDDNPTGTPSDAYNVELTVTDDDTGTSTDEVSITVHNVAPVITSVTASDDAPNEEEEVTLTIDFTDPGIADTFTVQVDWKDGTIDTYPVAADKRTIDVSHTYDDDDPTGTASDNHSVEVTVTDDDTLSDTTTIDLDVTNVDPGIESLSVTPDNHSENASDVVLALEFSDVSVKDSHTVTIDWGAGWSAGNSAAVAANDEDAAFSVDVSDEDARYTVVQIPALADLVDAGYWADGNKSRFLTATNRYGDNGVYTIQVTVVDDDTGQVVDSVTLTVDNTDPTHAINAGGVDGAITTAGGQTFIAREGEEVTITDTASDAGSDDLFFDWLFGDGNGILNTWLVGVPTLNVDDPAFSPQVSPRVDVTDSITHIYGSACLYGVSVHVTDDNDGDGGLDHIAVVIQALREEGDDRQRNFGQWSAEIRRGALGGDALDCYLDVAGYMSSVFVGPSELAGEPWAPATGYVDVTELDRQGVPEVLTAAPGGGQKTKLEREQVKLDRALLSAWLNFADGTWQWDTLIEDSDGDRVLDKTFGEVMTEIEEVRNTSTDDKEVQRTWQRLWQLGN